jgi:hypothetical protein
MKIHTERQTEDADYSRAAGSAVVHKIYELTKRQYEARRGE